MSGKTSPVYFPSMPIETQPLQSVTIDGRQIWCRGGYINVYKMWGPGTTLKCTKDADGQRTGRILALEDTGGVHVEEGARYVTVATRKQPRVRVEQRSVVEDAEEVDDTNPEVMKYIGGV